MLNVYKGPSPELYRKFSNLFIVISYKLLKFFACYIFVNRILELLLTDLMEGGRKLPSPPPTPIYE
jgi:hypothetical protein